MCFKQWLAGYIQESDPSGDLARMVYSDKKFPATGTYFEYLWYIGRKTDFNWFAVNLFIEAWSVYERMGLKEPSSVQNRLMLFACSLLGAFFSFASFVMAFYHEFNKFCDYQN